MRRRKTDNDGADERVALWGVAMRFEETALAVDVEFVKRKSDGGTWSQSLNLIRNINRSSFERIKVDEKVIRLNRGHYQKWIDLVIMHLEDPE